MTILYAPAFREQMDFLHANCLCTYDIQVLEILSANKKKGGGGQNTLLYLPHPKTPEPYNTIILDALDYCTIRQITSLQAAKDADLLVTDTSNIALSFSLFFLKPSLIYLPAFTDVEFGEDRFYALLQKIAFLATSLKELQNTLKAFKHTKDSKIQAITEFLQEDLL